MVFELLHGGPNDNRDENNLGVMVGGVSVGKESFGFEIKYCVEIWRQLIIYFMLWNVRLSYFVLSRHPVNLVFDTVNVNFFLYGKMILLCRRKCRLNVGHTFSSSLAFIIK